MMWWYNPEFNNISLQVEGVEYSETFARVAKMTSLQMLLAMVAIEDFELVQLDIKTSFLNDMPEEDIHMEQAEGFFMVL